MKKAINLMVVVTGIILSSSCSSTDTADLSIAESEALVSGAGTWKVSWYYDKDKDETSDFSGWEFELASDGSLIATKDSGTYTGTWNIESTDDSADYDKKMVFIITGPDPLDSMADDWLITEVSDSVLKLLDDSDNGIEELHLEK